MTTDTFRSPFVARGLFKPKNLWYGKYPRYDFHSNKITNDPSESEQWRCLKKMIDDTLSPMCYQLTVFDNRRNDVQKKGDIIFMQIDGRPINERYLNLSFLTWTFDPAFGSRIARSFTESIHNIGDQSIIEHERIREETFFEKWRSDIDRYKNFVATEKLLNTRL